MLGYPTQALARSQQGLTLHDERSSPFTLAVALYYNGMLRVYLRQEASSAQAQAETAIRLATAQGYAEQSWLATFLRGAAVAAQGQATEGIAQMHQGLARARSAGARLPLPRWLALLAAAYTKTGQAAAGLGVLEEALGLVHQYGICDHEAELYRLQGELLLQQAAAPQGEAETRLQQALTIARRQQAKAFELRAAMSLGRLWQQQGKRQEAYDLLAPIYHWFTEGFDTADLQDARALLAEL